METELLVTQQGVLVLSSQLHCTFAYGYKEFVAVLQLVQFPQFLDVACVIAQALLLKECVELLFAFVLQKTLLTAQCGLYLAACLGCSDE